MKSFLKDAVGYWLPVSPGAVLDYSVEWLDWIGTDTISSVVWTVPTGITSSAPTNTDSVARVWLSGFVDGTTYEIKCTVTTTAGRTDSREFRLVCKPR